MLVIPLDDDDCMTSLYLYRMVRLVSFADYGDRGFDDVLCAGRPVPLWAASYVYSFSLM